MKLKLTQTKLKGMHNAISWLLETPADRSNLLTQLLHELMDKFNERLRERLRKMEKEQKPECSLKLNTIEQRAFYSWYYLQRALLEFCDRWEYETLIMDGIASEIAKEHA